MPCARRGVPPIGAARGQGCAPCAVREVQCIQEALRACGGAQSTARAASAHPCRVRSMLAAPAASAAAVPVAALMRCWAL